VSPSTGQPIASDANGERISNTSVLYPSTGVTTLGLAFDGTNYLTVWNDNRDEQPFIASARVSPLTGQPLAADVNGVHVNDSASADDYTPQVTFDGSNYFIVWEDSDYPTSSIYGARLNPATGQVVSADAYYGHVIATGTNALHPAVSTDGTNDVVVWSDVTGTAKTRELFTSRVSRATGLPLAQDGNGVRVDTSAYAQDNPAIVYGGSQFLVAWEDSRNAPVTAAYGALVASSLVASTSNVFSESSSEDTMPVVASDGTNYMVAWIDNATGTGVVNTSLVDATTHAVVENVVGGSSTYTGTGLTSPAITSSGSNYLVAWTATPSIYEYGIAPTIFAAIVDAKTGVSANASRISYGTSVSAHVDDTTAHPAIAFDGSNYMVVWEDTPYGASGSAIWGIRVNSSTGNILPSDLPGISLGVNAYAQHQPAIAFDGTNYLVAWQDNRATANIYALRVSPTDGHALAADGSGVPLSANRFARSSPAIAFGGSNYLVAWTDDRNDPTYGDIYGARVATNGAAINVVTLAQDLAIAIAPQDDSAPAIADGHDGSNFQVVWQSARSGSSYDIYGTLVSYDGAVRDPSGVAFAMTTDQETLPKIAGAGAGQMLLVYQRLDTTAGYGSVRSRARSIDTGNGLGSMCTNDLDCDSRFCADGYCCNTACDGACETCSANAGTCTPVVNAVDNDTCATTCAADATSCQSSSTCNANGTCALDNGTLSTSGASCLSGFLSDGVCCDTPCTGGCGTCTKGGSVGICSPLTMGTPGVNGQCTTSDAGSGSLCDGMGLSCPGTCAIDTDCLSGEFCNANKSCQKPIAQGSACNASTDCGTNVNCVECTATNTCAITSCDADAGVVSIVATAGAGICTSTVTVKSQTCGGFACASNACKTKCTTTADCASNYTCDVMTGKCATSAVCLDTHTAEDISGNKTECSPYICSAGACENQCTSVADCVGGFICDSSGSCVSASDNTGTPSSSGCSCDAVGGRSRFGWCGLAMAGLVIARRRKTKVRSR
jgi:hypothetical protein